MEGLLYVNTAVCLKGHVEVKHNGGVLRGAARRRKHAGSYARLYFAYFCIKRSRNTTNANTTKRHHVIHSGGHFEQVPVRAAGTLMSYVFIIESNTRDKSFSSCDMCSRVAQRAWPGSECNQHTHTSPKNMLSVVCHAICKSSPPMAVCWPIR